MRLRALAVGAAMLVAACSGTNPSSTSPTTDPTTPTTDVPPTSIAPSTTVGERPTDPELDIDPDSHSALALPSTVAFAQLASVGIGGQEVVKFSITDFLGDATVEWLDSTFYTLHDEWYWFQLLNGDPVAGFDTVPIVGERFDDVAAVYDWADENRSNLPLDLRFTSLGRLYSPAFYDSALDDPKIRPVALGTVVHMPARVDDDDPDQEMPERWLLELEYGDEANAFQVARFFRLLIETLPEEIADELLWVPRSREQEIVADEMMAADLEFGDRTIRFDDLVVPGAIEVYAEGIAAGRLLLVTDDGRYSLSDGGQNDVVAVQRTPDALPPGNALITGTPQTPLAHVNVLALNRGIPNAFLGGLVDNPELGQLGRVRAPVAVRAVAPDQLDILALTETEFGEWRLRRGANPIAVPLVDAPSLPLIQNLSDLAATSPTERDIDELRPAIGGKAAGFLGLAAPATVIMPDAPVVITVRAYVEHMSQLDDIVDTMLTSDEFGDSARTRFLLLEGRDDYEQTYTNEADVAFAATFVAEHPVETVLGDIVEAGGLKQMIRDLDITTATLALIEDGLAANFAAFSPTQGLRFRSSSSVEDIEGFNGAGLYSSNTGYLDPTVLPDEDDHKRTVERALKRTWSSYWNIEAVEERRYENVDHRSGAMAVLVHARFDDPLEVSNGVATFTMLPPIDAGGADGGAGVDGGVGDDGGFVMKLNAQAGDTSVTNPTNEPGQAPEIVELRQAPNDDVPTVTRIASSSLVGDGDLVLDDDKLLTIWTQLRDVTVAWADRVNAELPVVEQITTLTLDFEFREMDAAWPALASGASAASNRIVIKQARTLEPGLRAIPTALTDMPIPRDVLARTARAVRVECPSATGAPDIFVDMFTDPLAAVDMGYATTPFRVVESGSPRRIADDSCTTTELFASANNYLLDLFDARGE